MSRCCTAMGSSIGFYQFSPTMVEALKTFPIHWKFLVLKIKNTWLICIVTIWPSNQSGCKPQIRAHPRANWQGCAKCGGTSPRSLKKFRRKAKKNVIKWRQIFIGRLFEMSVLGLSEIFFAKGSQKKISFFIIFNMGVCFSFYAIFWN